MYPILEAKKLADKIYLMVVKAPRISANCKPGEFVIVKMDEKGERIPITIHDYDREKGTVTIIVQTVGATTEKLSVCLRYRPEIPSATLSDRLETRPIS